MRLPSLKSKWWRTQIAAERITPRQSRSRSFVSKSVNLDFALLNLAEPQRRKKKPQEP
jgi:hypothetical protein